MKKVKWIFGILTLLTATYTFFALRAVMGNHILYINTVWGSLFVKTYRWALIATVAMAVVFLLMISRTRKSKVEKSQELERSDNDNEADN